MSKNHKILVLGANGLVGHTVYAYLKHIFPQTVWGTTRQNKTQTSLLYLSVDTFTKDLEYIYQTIGHIDYFINCIGLLKSSDEKKFIDVNTLFPQKLAASIANRRSYLIHISTDGIFDPMSGMVNEISRPHPIDMYAKSKLRGESNNPTTLTIRTSFLGNDPLHHTGLLEYALTTPSPVKGFHHQLWSGCTTTQFAKFCANFITHQLFTTLRRKTHILHFTPLRNVSKYDVIQSYITLLHLKKAVVPSSSPIVNRQLTSLFDDNIPLSLFSSNLASALQEHIVFERILV